MGSKASDTVIFFWKPHLAKVINLDAQLIVKREQDAAKAVFEAVLLRHALISAVGTHATTRIQKATRLGCLQKHHSRIIKPIVYCDPLLLRKTHSFHFPPSFENARGMREVKCSTCLG